ncbi:MAG: isoprenylcysteine carboxylmethyltransferase family protein [Verrucomicrobia bacterium]|nr:isoprenylcysteine carboxylmethyltransferase family protein [Verrucomicrobiota bacterium]
MDLVFNLIVQTIVWFGFMGAIIFGAAGRIDYAGGWLYLGEMIAISVVFGFYMARVDPGLLQERLKPPIQKDQPLADKLILIPLLLLLFGGMGFMAADGARWHWSITPPSVQGLGCVLLFAVILFMYWTMRTNSFAAPVVKIQKERGHTVITTGPYAIVRHPLYFGALFYVAATSLVLGSWWGLAIVPLVACGFVIRIRVEEKALREGLEGYDDYARRLRWRLVPFIW